MIDLLFGIAICVALGLLARNALFLIVGAICAGVVGPLFYSGYEGSHLYQGFLRTLEYAAGGGAVLFAKSLWLTRPGRGRGP